MFRFNLLKELTVLSDNIIDWTRSSELLFSKKHKYSDKEIFVRKSIIVTTVISSILGFYFNNSEKTQCANLTMGLISGLSVLLLTHSMAMAPAVKKRCTMRYECKILMKKIKEKSKLLGISEEIIDAELNSISQVSLANSTRANASQTWGRKKILLNNLYQQIEKELLSKTTATNSRTAFN